MRRQTQASSLSPRISAMLRMAEFASKRRVEPGWPSAPGYGSRLPVDTGDADPNFFLAQYGPRILSQLNLPRGRVRPNLSLDVAGGAELYRKEQRCAVLQLQASNLTNRVNVINFASLFSGTAVAPPRSVSARLRALRFSFRACQRPDRTGQP